MNEFSAIVCRVCLKLDCVESKCLSLFEKYNGELISEKINSFVSFSIKENDGLPDKICPECVLELENALRFRKKCETSNFVLRGTNVNKCEEMEVIKEEPPVYLEELEEYNIKEEKADDSEEHEFLECPNDECEVVKPIKKSRAIDLKIICHDCGGSFKSKCKLKVHWKRMHLPKCLLCPICKRQFKSYKAFNKHKDSATNCRIAAEMRIEGTGKSRVYYCKKCDYKTEHLNNVKNHLVTHSGAKPYKCEICSKSFTQIGSLHGHKEMAHEEYRVVATCQYCGKLIKGRGRLYKHIRTHRAPCFQCDICKKMFKTRESLKNHLQRHGDNKSYTCEICAASFYTATDLMNHKRNQHTNYEKRSCEICGYVNKTYASMIKHKKKHTATSICCLLCGKFSNNEEDHKEHMKFHVGKKHPCPDCVRTYNCRKSLYRHLFMHHNPDNKCIVRKGTVVVKKES